MTAPPKPKRRRRTKAEMAAARADAAMAALLAEAEGAVKARLAASTPGQIWIAEKIVRRWSRPRRWE